jgi:hypothetical protein
MGAIPAAGQWVRLEVPASQVGLEGRTIKGMAFSLYGGRATWDEAGKSSEQGGGANDRIVLSISKAAGSIRLTWSSVVGKTYRVWYKNNLADAVWTPVNANIIATGTSSSWTDDSTGASPNRFYIVSRIN